eukprot:3221365-Rhodomonas_salina.2
MVALRLRAGYCTDTGAPLHVAAQIGHVEVVDLLIGAKCNVDQKAGRLEAKVKYAGMIWTD